LGLGHGISSKSCFGRTEGLSYEPQCTCKRHRVPRRDACRVELRARNAAIMTSPKPFSRAAWERNAGLYEVIRTMPFNRESAAGTLSEARFKHYIIQDPHYLTGFGRALLLPSAKTPAPDGIVQFAKSAEGAFVVKRALHGSFFERYGISPRTSADTP